jgi:Bacterial SH3 domain
MATVEMTDVRPNESSFAEGTLNVSAELWAPPLAPNETTADGYVLLSEDAIHPVGGDDPLLPPEPSNLSEAMTRRPNLIAGTAIVAALGIAGLTYFFMASPGPKAPAETAETSPIAVQSSSETSAQAAFNLPEPSSSPTVEPAQPALPEPSRGASGATPSPPVPAPLTAEAPPKIASSAVTPNRDDLVFLQRPGVNIRSAPSGNAPVLGTAPKGTRFTATSREGDWVQVENPNWKGWINSQFLAPNKPL